MAKKRGNPNLGKPEVNAIPYTGANSFDEIVKKFHLSPFQYEGSIHLQEWARKNKDQEIRTVEPATGMEIGCESGLLSAWASGISGARTP